METVLCVTIGHVSGYIGYVAKGENGFGYDPLFFYPPEGKTFAELNDEKKNKVSHRSQAMRRMKDFLLQFNMGS